MQISLITVIWSMIAAVCFTLAAIYLLVWRRNHTAWANLLFCLTAVSTAAFAFCELRMMRAETPAEFATTLKWAHVPVWLLVVSLVGFVRFYLKAGRTWLAWMVCGLRTLALLLNFSGGAESQLPRDHDLTTHLVSRRIRLGSRWRAQSLDGGRSTKFDDAPHLCRRRQCHCLAARRPP